MRSYAAVRNRENRQNLSAGRPSVCAARPSAPGCYPPAVRSMFFFESCLVRTLLCAPPTPNSGSGLRPPSPDGGFFLPRREQVYFSASQKSRAARARADFSAGARQNYYKGLVGSTAGRRGRVRRNRRVRKANLIVLSNRCPHRTQTRNASRPISPRSA